MFWTCSEVASNRLCPRLALVCLSQVQAVLDAPLQMRRETDTLRAQSGMAGDNDMEALMLAVAGAWVGDTPSRGLSYDGTALTVNLPGDWTQFQSEQLRTRLQAAGFAVEQADGRMTVRRAPSQRGG